jgi:hypothetical protein
MSVPPPSASSAPRTADRAAGRRGAVSRHSRVLPLSDDAAMSFPSANLEPSWEGKIRQHRGAARGIAALRMQARISPSPPVRPDVRSWSRRRETARTTAWSRARRSCPGRQSPRYPRSAGSRPRSPIGRHVMEVPLPNVRRCTLRAPSRPRESSAELSLDGGPGALIDGVATARPPGAGLLDQDA